MRLTLDNMNERLDNKSAYGSSNFKFVNEFYLRRDKETAIVKFLIKDITEIEMHGVHVVKMTSSKSGKSYMLHVDCLGDGCPFCKEAPNHEKEMYPLVSKVKDNIYIPLINMYNLISGEYKPEYMVWARPSNFYRNVLVSYNKRNSIEGLIEIERTGTAPRVTYNLYEARKDIGGIPINDGRSLLNPIASKTIEQLKEEYDVREDDIFGRTDSLIRNWTPIQMQAFLANPLEYPRDSLTEVPQTQAPPEVKMRTSSHGF